MNQSRPTTNNVGFAIVCQNRNLGGFRTTLRTIQGSFPNAPKVCVLPDDTTDVELGGFAVNCKCQRGGKTLQSMTNTGFTLCESEWVMILSAGRVIRTGFLKPYLRFCEGEMDVLYAVLGRTWPFVEGGVAGLLMNREKFLSSGGLDHDEPDWVKAKTMWAASLVDSGFKIKGLVGVPM